MHGIAAAGVQLAGGVGPVGIAGDSSGGNLAAVATRELSREGRAPCFQVLLYPMLDATASSPSYLDFATGYGFTRDKSLWYFSQYRCPGDGLGAVGCAELAGSFRAVQLLQCFGPLPRPGVEGLECWYERRSQIGEPVGAGFVTG